MRILQVITSLSIGGAEKLIAEIVPLLRSKGHEVDVLAFDGKETHFLRMLREQGIRVMSFGENCKVYNPLFIFRLTKLMRKYDIVHTHNTACQLFAAIGSVLCSVVLCTTEHNTSNRRRAWKWYAPVDRWMYTRYKKVICISDKAEENLRATHPSLQNICTIYNGVNVQKFHDALPLPNIKPKGKKVLMMVAGFRYQKDQTTLIKALTHLDANGYELWLVGDGEFRGELESLARELGVGDRVKFLGIRPDVPELLTTADVVVMSSHFEGLSLSSVEGMSVGKPFVASDVDGLHEVVSGYGVLFPHGDDKALANVLNQLCTPPDYYQQVAEKCWERAQMFDIYKMVDSYHQVYLEVMKGESH